MRASPGKARASKGLPRRAKKIRIPGLQPFYKVANACLPISRGSFEISGRDKEIRVAKAELGMKLTCDSCGARFYDLNKQPGICPKCGTANARPVIFKASRGRPAEEKV